MNRTYTTTVSLTASPEELFAFFADAFNLQAITPPWLDFRVLTPAPIDVREGTLIDYKLRLRGLPIRWRTRIAAWEPSSRFIDEQLKGPYRLWRHEHTFEAIPPGLGGGTRCVDRVEYRVPGWILEPVIHQWLVRRDIERIFRYRRDRMIERFGEAIAPRSRTE